MLSWISRYHYPRHRGFLARTDASWFHSVPGSRSAELPFTVARSLFSHLALCSVFHMRTTSTKKGTQKLIKHINAMLNVLPYKPKILPELICLGTPPTGIFYVFLQVHATRSTISGSFTPNEHGLESEPPFLNTRRSSSLK